MIRGQHQQALEAIVVELDESKPAEAATKTVLLTVLAANEKNEEAALLDHVTMFARRLLRSMEPKPQMTMDY